MSQPLLVLHMHRTPSWGRLNHAHTILRGCHKRIIHSDLSNGPGVPRGENPPPLQAYEWPIGDRGAFILPDPSPTQLFE